MCQLSFPAVQEERGPRKNKGTKKNAAARRAVILDTSNVATPPSLTSFPSIEVRPFIASGNSHFTWGSCLSAFRPVQPRSRDLLPWQPTGSFPSMLFGDFTPDLLKCSDLSSGTTREYITVIHVVSVSVKGKSSCLHAIITHSAHGDKFTFH